MKTDLGLGRVVLRAVKDDVVDLEMRLAIVGLLDALFEEADIEAIVTVCGSGLRAAVFEAWVAIRDPAALRELARRQVLDDEDPPELDEHWNANRDGRDEPGGER